VRDSSSITDVAARVCSMLAEKLRGFDSDSVISPALGGIIVFFRPGSWAFVRQTSYLPEKEDGKLRCAAIQIDQGEKFVVVEDVVTRGGRVQERSTSSHARRNGRRRRVIVIAAANQPDFGCPFVSLVEMSVGGICRG